MKKSLIHTTFCFAMLFTHSKTYATTDSLPSCIVNISTTDIHTFTEYEYKGQRWFSFTQVAEAPDSKISDKLTTTRFYDYNCRLQCTWMKGGIAGFNKATPDTIEKSKIKIVHIDTFNLDSIKKGKSIGQLPDTIIKLALLSNSKKIQEYLYKNQKLYYIISGIPRKNPAELFDDPYYDSTGKIIIAYRRSINPAFKRSWRWIPDSVKSGDLVAVPKGIWNRKENSYIKESQFMPGYR